MKIAVALALLTSAGCASWYEPSQAEFQEAEAKSLHGPRPDAGQLVNGYLRVALKDPYSVRDLAIGEVEKSYIRTGQDLWGRNEFVWCWRTIVQYNAKNSFGAYVGLRSYMYYMRSDRGVILVEE